MSTLPYLIKRNIKVFFKDKGMFFTSLITPGILLVLYVTFLGNLYKQTFNSFIPADLVGVIPKKIVNAAVGGQLAASLLAVCCVTVAFCCNMLMVQDKVTGARNDFLVTPVSKSAMALGYYIATFVATAIVCLGAAALCFGYLAIVGWYLSFIDVLLLIADVLLLVLFGTAISSLINVFLSTQGQISAVGTIVSAGYGFICGAYMPISQFNEGLQKAVMFLPGTYGTALIKNHTLRGPLNELAKYSFPIEQIKADLDCKLLFFGSNVSFSAMYAVLVISITVLIAVYVGINLLRKNKKK